MVSKRKKKYEAGEGAQFVSRKQALRMLQLSLKDFRKLCILKGIYPREPRKRKRAQKGAPGIKTLYHKKDIQFLMHEPIIWNLRDLKVYGKKVGRAKSLRDFKTFRRYIDNHPTLKLDHIVKERYPTFIDAIRDLDDCLTLCFLFATFPSLPHLPRDQAILCRRLTVEFMHYVIAAKALRKVFVSIKGYYYQAEIKGQTVTWIVPHHFSFQPQSKDEVDFKVMSTFVEFYLIMLGFVNFRLYHSLNMYYPPKFLEYSVGDSERSLVDEEHYVAERIAALNVTLARSVTDLGEEEETEIDKFELTDDPKKLEEAKAEAERVKTLKTLFKGLKFFINREVPREPAVFIIRCFGGEVSWDKTLYVGASYDEEDETITHHIVDRPSMSKQYISRYYVQPQWLFDSVNARTLLPEEKYFMGVTLPPHLSPFVDDSRDDRYIPPEERALLDPSLQEVQDKEEEEENEVEEEEDADSDHNSGDEEDDDDDDDEEEENLDKEDHTEKKSVLDDKKRQKIEQEQKKKKMSVNVGTVNQSDPKAEAQLQRQEYKLREKMVHRKHRRLYKSMLEGRKERRKEAWLLNKKRLRYEEEEKQKKKLQKKQKLKDAITLTATS